ncbi:hypothetical protein LTS18_007115 [Coniosporium uncinatum]|uniref:Uncharacterized protein n=1 Tax=Coniosporium uncinatum TaxID=93489 RepID=A0ACC3DAH4_9PEZI|nr:hypothetical protein LTS18_007115 [Coniosporium uncinatum]
MFAALSRALSSSPLRNQGHEDRTTPHHARAFPGLPNRIFDHTAGGAEAYVEPTSDGQAPIDEDKRASSMWRRRTGLEGKQRKDVQSHDSGDPTFMVYEEEELSRAAKTQALLSNASALLRHTDLAVARNTNSGDWGVIKRGSRENREYAPPAKAISVIAEVEHQRGVHAAQTGSEKGGLKAFSVSDF